MVQFREQATGSREQTAPGGHPVRDLVGGQRAGYLFAHAFLFTAFASGNG